MAVADTPRIERFTLVDATLDRTIRSLADGDTLDLATFQDRTLTIEAYTQPRRVSKVVFSLQGPIVYTNTERSRPYALFGSKTRNNGSCDYIGLRWNTGRYTLQATAHDAAIVGDTQTITFTVVDSREPPTRVITPQLRVYPVPTTGPVTLSYEGFSEETTLMLVDHQGSLLLQRPLGRQSTEQLAVDTYGRGLYYLKIVSEQGVLLRKLVVE